ncbi:MAG: hypothetical protein PHY79_14180 [Anaerolineae bacterium]|nr:hypothetical protein [Anaerolineae bacterium]
MDNLEERLASFYLGQEYDLAKGQALDKAVHYDARDLTTHAVCVGMTGSGKTGLGVILLEEAALDGIPSLVIDPKGDMTNLLLTFPDLRPEDFRPWVNPDDARRKDMDEDTFAAKVASQWREGLAATGQGPDRIRRLRESADFAIFTPGSNAGRQISILDTLKAPTLSWETEGEQLRDKIESVVSALLALIGIEADPVRSKEHILLSNIFQNAWRAGQDLDLAQLIMRVQKPPFTQLGVFPLDVFFPEKERMQLAMLLNGLVASPTFAGWMQGQPLDVQELLYGPGDRPQVSVIYIAHLSDAERQFFLTLLLEQVVSWMRAQTGTTSLRALLYMDEMFGFLPPTANPPTKKPLLTLLKQARAFGLGLILATQNPVDLDYKALTNAGTWLIGRMQADRDKQRLLDGLEGVQLRGGASRSDFDRMISALGSRVFLLHNVHAGEPGVFTTRWAMSYLRGPLTRDQVRTLVADAAPAAVSAASPRQAASPQAAAAAPVAPASHRPATVPPQMPSSVKQVFLPARRSLRAALADQGWQAPAGSEPKAALRYEPGLLGTGTVRFAHSASRQSHDEPVAYLLPVGGAHPTFDWSGARVQMDTTDLEREPRSEGTFSQLPRELGDAKRYTALKKEFEDYLYYNSSRMLLYNPHLKLYSEIGENDKAFQRRCRQAAEGAVAKEEAALKTKYERELKRLEDKLRREEQEMEADKAEYDARKQEELLSGAESILGLFTGRKSSSRLSSASRKRRMTTKAKADVEESEETIAALEKQIEELEAKAADEVEAVTNKWNDLIDDVQEVEVRPRRADVRLDLFALAWLPYWQLGSGDQARLAPAYEAEALPA